MRLLLLYYSVYGTNEKLAQELQKAIGCDMEKIIENKDRRGFWNFIMSGRDALKKNTTKIEPIKSNLTLYDVVVLGTPFWVGTLPPATRTFIRQYKDKIKRLGIISVSGNGAGNQNAIAELASESGKNIDPKMLLIQKEFKRGTYRKKFDELVKNLKTLKNVKGDLQR